MNALPHRNFPSAMFVTIIIHSEKEEKPTYLALKSSVDKL